MFLPDQDAETRIGSVTLPIRPRSTFSDSLSDDTTHRSTVLEAFPRYYYSLTFHPEPPQKHGQLVRGWYAVTARTTKHSAAEECLPSPRKFDPRPPWCCLWWTKVWSEYTNDDTSLCAHTQRSKVWGVGIVYTVPQMWRNGTVMCFSKCCSTSCNI